MGGAEAGNWKCSPRPEETCVLKGRGMWLLSASLSSPPPLESMKLQALLCFKRQLRLPFLLMFQNASIITEKGVIIGLLIETYEANKFAQENNLKVKGNPNRNSGSSVEKYIKREGEVKGGHTAPESLWGLWNPHR